MLRGIVVGAGTMGLVHAQHYRDNSQVTLVGIVDTNEEAGLRLAQAMGVPWYAHMEAVPETLNFCDVNTPTPMHVPLARQAMQLGMDVILEKPVARSHDEAWQLGQLANTLGRSLLVGHVLRFFPQYEKARQLCVAGEVGRVGMVHMTRGGRSPVGFNHWYADPKLSGGLILDMIIHDFDWLRWTFGEVEHVFAQSTPVGPGQYALVTLRLASGVIAHVEGSWAHDRNFASSLEVAGSEGVLHFDSTNVVPLWQEGVSDEQRMGVAIPESPAHTSPYDRELAHFVDVLQHGGEPRVQFADALAAMDIAFAAMKSAKIGEPVYLEEVRRQEV